MRVLLSLSLLAAGLPAAANGHRAMTPRDVVELKQVSDPQISADGAHGLREPNHQLDKMEREMAWFDKWVLGEGK